MSSKDNALPSANCDSTSSLNCVDALAPAWSGTASSKDPQSMRRSSPDFCRTGCSKSEARRTVMALSRERDQTTSCVPLSTAKRSICGEQQLNTVRSRVLRMHRHSDVGDGPRHQVRVARKHGRQEIHFQRDPLPGKLIDRVRRRSVSDPSAAARPLRGGSLPSSEKQSRRCEPAQSGVAPCPSNGE